MQEVIGIGQEAIEVGRDAGRPVDPRSGHRRRRLSGAGVRKAPLAASRRAQRCAGRLAERPAAGSGTDLVAVPSGARDLCRHLLRDAAAGGRAGDRLGARDRPVPAGRLVGQSRRGRLDRLVCRKQGPAEQGDRQRPATDPAVRARGGVVDRAAFDPQQSRLRRHRPGRRPRHRRHRGSARRPEHPGRPVRLARDRARPALRGRRRRPFGRQVRHRRADRHQDHPAAQPLRRGADRLQRRSAGLAHPQLQAHGGAPRGVHDRRSPTRRPPRRSRSCRACCAPSSKRRGRCASIAPTSRATAISPWSTRSSTGR